jgi:hypothetical protein
MCKCSRSVQQARTFIQALDFLGWKAVGINESMADLKGEIVTGGKAWQGRRDVKSKRRTGGEWYSYLSARRGREEASVGAVSPLGHSHVVGLYCKSLLWLNGELARYGSSGFFPAITRMSYALRLSTRGTDDEG